MNQMKLLLSLLATAASGKPLEGSVFFTSLSSGDLVRLDCGKDGCGAPVSILSGLENYGGLVPWKGRLLGALKSQKVVTLDPWCKDCPVSPLVDVKRVVGGQGSFNVRGMTWCQDALFVVFAGPDASGMLRCTCTPRVQDCTGNCSLVDGVSDLKPGNGTQQLSDFAASVACLDEKVLVADNSNFRLQSVPASCTQRPCHVETFAQGLLWPLGVAVVHHRVLVTLDEGIVVLQPDGTARNFSSHGDTGFLCEGDGQILVASGGDGNILSFDPACEGPDCTATLVWNSTGSTARAATAIAYMRQQASTVLV